MAKSKGMPLGTFLKLYSNEKQCEDRLVTLRWKDGYVCPKCGCHHANRLPNGRYQCAQCRHQVSVTAGTVLHKTHMPLRQWFLAFYFVCQDKRVISAKQLQLILGTTYKTAWYILVRIRAAMGQRDQTHQLSGIIEFDDTYFGGPTVGKRRGRGTEKAKVFVALSLDERGNPRFLKMQETPNIKQASVKKFANAAFTPGSEIHSDGYRSYIPALEGFVHKHKVYDPNSGLLHWLHIVISNAKAFILGTYSSITGGVSHFMEWKDAYPYKLRDINPNGKPSAQEIAVAGMFEPSHLLDIVQNFIAYKDEDSGIRVKLVPRYMQFRGANKIIERLRSAAKGEKGGTLWHTQGTGKTLTMMFVIRKMYNSFDLNNYKVVLIVDRKDLQTQMFKTTKTVKYAVNTADSIEGLKKLIANTASDVTVAMVHKFGEAEKDKKDKKKSGTLEQRTSVSTFPVLNTSDRILVMIDEAHRSEYSELAANMWKSMPNSVKVAFTGTPITKTVDNFGGYVDTYTMRQAEEDGIVVEIKYEGRATDSEITDHDAMNHAFIDIFGYLEDEEQLEILGKYTVRGYLEAWEVIQEKASDRGLPGALGAEPQAHHLHLP